MGWLKGMRNINKYKGRAGVEYKYGTARKLGKKGRSVGVKARGLIVYLQIDSWLGGWEDNGGDRTQQGRGEDSGEEKRERG